MTIHNMDAYTAAVWDYKILDGCLGRGNIKPTDVDGLVERNDRFLFMEYKPTGKVLSKGQERTFRALLHNPDNNVVVIEGNPMTETITRILWRHLDETFDHPFQNGDGRGAFRVLVAEWFRAADTRLPFDLNAASRAALK